ncbi:MAG: PIG-L family deacetylase [Candidatus Gastranaerophilales bacterium]|nr:PIG-L family deacetylase [Candidatus Gastranaerophilales bacterium]
MRKLIFKNLISHIYRIYFSINLQPRELHFKKDARCLILAPHADDESIGCGGVLLKYPKMFDVYCLTNGFKGVEIPNLTYEEKIEVRKNEFIEAMEKAGVNYYSFFEDVDDKRLIMRYDKFSSINVSHYDYIFIPNILDQHRDHKAVALMLNELLKDKAHKHNVKIVMYEVWTALALPNFFVDIEDVMDAKIELIKTHKSQIATRDYTNKVRGLNSYRALGPQRQYVEAYCVLELNEFKKICKMYSI